MHQSYLVNFSLIALILKYYTMLYLIEVWIFKILKNCYLI